MTETAALKATRVYSPTDATFDTLKYLCNVNKHEDINLSINVLKRTRPTTAL